MRPVKNIGAEEALLGDDPIMRIMARSSTSTWAEHFQQWVDDELNRGEDPKYLLFAIMAMQVMTHSSVAANLVEPGGYQAIADSYKDLIDQRWIRHAHLSRAYIESIEA
ncbi:hypothetical protein ACIQUB_07135 [Rhizobium sp. NPDC090275]|uniref:hypothetical protein n=1 Tax=Rhizobium sp. NPDC090275 TaxID=3364498 RepID=UPI00383B59C9